VADGQRRSKTTDPMIARVYTFRLASFWTTRPLVSATERGLAHFGASHSWSFSAWS